MSERPDSRGDLAAYMMGALEGDEREAFEAALARDGELSAELRELTATVVLLEEAAEPFEVPDGLADRVRAAIADAGAGSVARGPGARSVSPLRVAQPTAATSEQPGFWERLGWSRPRRVAVAGGLAAALALAVLAGTQIGGGPDGELEVSGQLAGAEGDQLASIDVRELGIGREIELESDELAILPKGEFYEVWFVGPGDSRGDPNRISAGTFHPDAEGRSDVIFTAAVDPELYPLIEITAEPGDGDPGPSRAVVATLDSSS